LAEENSIESLGF
ncbi:unnamed protein product, partial [Allacma fusca]